jgi:fluoroquinolone transport system permease protein
VSSLRAPTWRGIALDLRLQRRYGIWGTTAALTGVWVVLLRVVPATVRPDVLVAVTVAHMTIVGFSFVGALVLFEKAEQTLAAVVVSPLRPAAYLTAKVASLLLLAVGVAGIVVVAAEVPVALAPLGAGVVLLSVVGVLAGVCSVAPFDSLSRWLFPSVPVLLLLAAPLSVYAGAPPWALRPLPTTGALSLLRAAVGSGQVDPVAVAGGLVWAAVLARAAHVLFRRFVVEGGR